MNATAALCWFQALAIGLVAGADSIAAWSWLAPVPLAATAAPLWMPPLQAALRRQGARRLAGPRRRPRVPDPELTTFLESVNHELRTPLNSILGFSDLLLQDIDGPLRADRRENLQVIRDAGASLLSLFDDVTELLALMGGQATPGAEQVSLHELLSEAAAAVQLPLRVAPGDPVVAADAVRVTRALRDLSRHAVAAARGRPGVTLVPTPTHVRVRWHVPGDVPDVDQLRALFEPHGSPEGLPRRTRLDFSIARRVAELHGGGLRVRASDEGQIWELRLPRSGKVST